MNRLAILLLFAVTLAAGIGFAMTGGPGPTKRNLDRVAIGATKAEALAILGPEDMSARIGTVTGGDRRPPAVFVFEWSNDDGSGCQVWFEDDCVSEKEWRDSHETILDRIRRYLGTR